MLIEFEIYSYLSQSSCKVSEICEAYFSSWFKVNYFHTSSFIHKHVHVKIVSKCVSITPIFKYDSVAATLGAIFGI